MEHRPYVAWPKTEPFLSGAKQANDVCMRNHHPLGLAVEPDV
jgi:hypothetical protein